MARSSGAEQAKNTGFFGRSRVRLTPGRQPIIQHIREEEIRVTLAVVILIGIGALAIWEATR